VSAARAHGRPWQHRPPTPPAACLPVLPACPTAKSLRPAHLPCGWSSSSSMLGSSVASASAPMVSMIRLTHSSCRRRHGGEGRVRQARLAGLTGRSQRQAPLSRCPNSGRHRELQAAASQPAGLAWRRQGLRCSGAAAPTACRRRRTCSTLSGTRPPASAPTNAMMSATRLTVSWNCRNLRMEANTERPHSTDLTMEEKLSSRMTMSAASLATSVPAGRGRGWGGWGCVGGCAGRAGAERQGGGLPAAGVGCVRAAGSPAMPMARPTSDSLRAGASLVPSPVTATTSPCLLSSDTSTSLSSGEERARTCRRGRGGGAGKGRRHRRRTEPQPPASSQGAWPEQALPQQALTAPGPPAAWAGWAAARSPA
jgi:hypothetical protein